MKKRIIFMSLLAIGLLLTACYYDKEEVLYGNAATACDTTAVTYAGTIAPIMSANCNSCHSGSAASGGVVTSTYASLSVIALNGTLGHSVNWDNSLSPMPKGGSKLPTCDLSKIKKWVNLGAPNN